MRVILKKVASIVVLTYKRYDNLKENLESIFSQNYPNIEIIISDDASDNFDREYVESLLKEKTANIKSVKIVHHEKNVGTVRNFNEAIKIATGEYIFPLSQDDSFYNETVVSNIVENFGDSLIVTGVRVAISEETNEIVGEFPLLKDRERVSKDNFYKFLILNGNIISGASTYYKKEVFEKYGYFDERMRLLEDIPFYLRSLRNGIKVKFIDVKTIKYGMGGISTGKIVNKTLLKDFIEMESIEENYNNGFVKRCIIFNRELKQKILNDKMKVGVYLKYPDITIIKIINKISKKLLDYDFLLKISNL